MENKEAVLEALEVFNKKIIENEPEIKKNEDGDSNEIKSSEEKEPEEQTTPKEDIEIPAILENYLRHIATTGETIVPWEKIKHLFVKKMDNVIHDFEKQVPMDDLPPLPNVENCKFDLMKRRLHHTVDRFLGIPFTIQRLCELLLDPKKHYKRPDKFMRGVEKNLMVVSTVDPYGNKIVNEKQVLTVRSPHSMNGYDTPTSNDHKSDSTPLAPFLPPMNQGAGNSAFAWFNTAISNLNESNSTAAPWNFTGTPLGAVNTDDVRPPDGITSSLKNSMPPHHDDDIGKNNETSQGESSEKFSHQPSESMDTSDFQDRSEKTDDHPPPERDNSEEPPSKRLKEADDGSLHEGQGDMSEQDVGSTEDENTVSVAATKSIAEDVTDRRSSGGFEVSSSSSTGHDKSAHVKDTQSMPVQSTSSSSPNKDNISTKPSQTHPSSDSTLCSSSTQNEAEQKSDITGMDTESESESAESQDKPNEAAEKVKDEVTDIIKSTSRDQDQHDKDSNEPSESKCTPDKEDVTDEKQTDSDMETETPDSKADQSQEVSAAKPVDTETTENVTSSTEVTATSTATIEARTVDTTSDTTLDTTLDTPIKAAENTTKDQCTSSEVEMSTASSSETSTPVTDEDSNNSDEFFDAKISQTPEKSVSTRVEETIAATDPVDSSSTSESNQETSKCEQDQDDSSNSSEDNNTPSSSANQIQETDEKQEAMDTD